LLEITELRNKYNQAKEAEIRNILLMTEVERLTEILNQKAEPQSSPTKGLQEIEINNLKGKISEMEKQNRFLSDQVTKALNDVEDWKRKAQGHERTRSQDFDFSGTYNGEEREMRAGVVPDCFVFFIK
jgi:hypothetical protein